MKSEPLVEVSNRSGSRRQRSPIESKPLANELASHPSEVLKKPKKEEQVEDDMKFLNVSCVFTWSLVLL